MFILKHLKTLQHVSIIIQIIFSELVCSLLKSLILKFIKNINSQCGDAAACLNPQTRKTPFCLTTAGTNPVTLFSCVLFKLFICLLPNVTNIY